MTWEPNSNNFNSTMSNVFKGSQEIKILITKDEFLGGGSVSVPGEMSNSANSQARVLFARSRSSQTLNSGTVLLIWVGLLFVDISVPPGSREPVCFSGQYLSPLHTGERAFTRAPSRQINIFLTAFTDRKERRREIRRFA